MHRIVEPKNSMTRVKLFQIRFAATVGLLLLTFLMLRYLWFPDAFFTLSGIGKLVLILVGVNIIVGPVLSTLVFKAGKRGLKFDIAVLACVEIVILAWGLSVIHDRRPMFAVFAVDRFELVARAELDPKTLSDTEFAVSRGLYPQLIYAELPTDVDVMNRLIDETVLYGMRDIDRRPEFWRPYAHGVEVLKSAAMPLSKLLAVDDGPARALQRWLARKDLRAIDYLYLPIEGSSADGIVVLHADIGYPVDILAIDPWPDSLE
jgi:hypothetical protein